MLLRFEVENFLSLRNATELTLIASALRDEGVDLITSSAVPNQEILPCSVIYGANASGKSNLVSALSMMRAMVLNSHSKQDPDETLDHPYFLLDTGSAIRPTSFECEFVTNQVRYQYGFSFNEEAITGEWLYSYPKGRRLTLYTREHGNFTFGRSLKGNNTTISKLTRDNSLFLSAAAQNDHSELTRLYRYFRSIHITSSVDVSSSFASFTLRNKNAIDERVIKFLRKIGTGVVGYKRIENDVPAENQDFRRKLVELLSQTVDNAARLSDYVSETKSVEIQLAHTSIDGELIHLDLAQESAGTRRLLVLLTSIFAAIDKGRVIVIDELDASLHTVACESLISLFGSRITNPSGAQLIATTHDTNLMLSSSMRRDQVWFCEKDDAGASAIYPLTDFSTRSTDNIEKGYLQGRFGGIPNSPLDDRFLLRK